MNTKTYLIPDMSCAHCKAHIEKEVTGLNGVEAADVPVESKVLTVRFDDQVVDSVAIVAAVAEAGYTANPQ
ncbi:copper chaperone [Aerococcus sp. 150760007-1]|uniref:Heavy-metal-associated domain-containing protein n=1 Tax=Aerococcus urinaeequi TaxID=51665 RepID=A0ABR5ZZH1_9LACT|nr:MULTISPECIES: heavy-metal-associated domain-containing protein [Lactobacillales]KAF3304739.1 copper chaperone [Carnobacterium sp. PL17GRE32]MBA5747119.1 heavy-metal-associated domain-containing protein [Aerococcus urinaeequi]MBA5829903.1 heavy-metal-associated domain-containing protein [Aerococcus urinaeequi]MBA5860511.1 heavy-metal-associated domain-containing protein [Aerococcus urinaeequi]HCT97559.1 copper chaperone [Aerococcus urinaeequi]